MIIYDAYFGGGLGDIIKDYFFFKPFSCIDFLIKNKIKINCHLRTHNINSVQILETNPFIDNIIKYDMKNDWNKKNNEKIFFEFKQDKAKKNKIYLNDEDLLIIKNLKLKNPYCVIHPFSGDNLRTWNNNVDVNNMAFFLKKNGYDVVVIGGNHIREQKERKENIIDVFDYDENLCFNYVNKYNLRILSEILKMSSFFIGTYSCFLVLSWALNIKNMAIIPNNFEFNKKSFFYSNLIKKSNFLNYNNLDKKNNFLKNFLNLKSKIKLS